MTVQTPNAAAAPAGPSFAARAAQLGFSDSHGDEGDVMLGIGFWGAGLSAKTTHMLSFPGPVVFNYDPTTSTITKQRERIPFVQVRSVAQMKALAQAAAAKQLTALVRTMPGFEDYTVQSVLTDSSTFQAALVEEWLDTQDFTSKRGADDSRARYQAKLVCLNEYYRLMKHAREYEKGKEQYYHLVAIHEKITLSEKGEITKIQADITGDYNRLIFQQNDINLFCELLSPAGSDGKVAQIGTGDATGPARPKAIVRSVPHTKWHSPVVDRVGGLGRFGQLPPILYPPPNAKGGLFSLLNEHWLGSGKSK